MTTHTIHVGNSLQVLRSLPAAGAHACVTSPPFWALRDYGVSGQFGLESTPQRWVVNQLRVFREVWRILAEDGQLWIEIGDCYAGDGGAGGGGWFGGRGPAEARVSQRARKYSGAKIKDLVGIPWMLAFALRSRGWYWRQTCIWARGNARPEGAQDRPHTAHTVVLQFSKREGYFYDTEAVKQPTKPGKKKSRGPRVDLVSHPSPATSRLRPRAAAERRHLRSVEPPPEMAYPEVWWIDSAAGEDGHPAAFPPELAARCILASTRPGDVVLDPYLGSGTVAWTAKRLGRSSIGVELNPTWAEQAELRVAQGVLFDAPAPVPIRQQTRTDTQGLLPLAAGEEE